MTTSTGAGRDQLDATPAATGGSPRWPLVAAAVATVLVGFAVGVLLEGARRGEQPELAVPVERTTSTPTAAPATTAGPSSSAPTTTVVTTGASTTSAPAVAATPSTSSTTPPTSTPPASSPTTQVSIAPTTVRVVPTPPPTIASPPFLTAAYPPGPGGALAVPRGGTGVFVLTNTGGLATQWLLAGSGFVVQGPQQGLLEPGASVSIAIAPRSAESTAGGTVNVLGPNPLAVPFVVV